MFERPSTPPHFPRQPPSHFASATPASPTRPGAPIALAPPLVSNHHAYQYSESKPQGEVSVKGESLLTTQPVVHTAVQPSEQISQGQPKQPIPAVQQRQSTVVQSKQPISEAQPTAPSPVVQPAEPISKVQPTEQVLVVQPVPARDPIPISGGPNKDKIAPGTPVIGPITFIDPTIVPDEELLLQERLAHAKEEQERIAAAVQAERRKGQRRIPAMDDEDLNALIRSAQKLVRYVHIAPPAYGDKPEDELDLNPAEEEELSIDKLRSHLERFYASVVFSGMRVVQEVIRLRRWESRERTGVALLVYTIAWLYGLVFFTFFAFLTTLVLYPPSRSYCFGPPHHYVSVPIDPSRPDERTPLLISEGEERPWGPAASERQATAWADQVQSVISSLVVPGGSKGGKGEEVVEKVEKEVNGVMVKDMKHHSKGEHAGEDMGKKEMAIEMYGKPGMKIIGGLVDKWERIANAIEPTPPFVKPSRHRVFYTLLLPALVGSFLVTPKLVSLGAGAGFGFVLFGKPVIDWTIEELDRRIPTWRRKLIIEFNILADVPTNPQLVLRLMRDAEHQRAPLELPGPPAEPGTAEADESSDEYSEDDHDPTAKEKIGVVGKKVKDGTRTKVRKTWDKLGEMKEESFALVTGHKKVNYEERARKTMDTLHISQDSQPAAALLKKLPAVPEDDSPDMPSRFYVNHSKHGPGHLIIYPPTLPTASNAFTPARISFTTVSKVPKSQSVSLDPDQLDPVSNHLNPNKGDLVISINDIIAMRKTGLGKIASMGVSWALDVQDAGGTGLDLTIIRRGPVVNGRQEGMNGREEKMELKKIVRRDELFDRLLALGEQRWELM